MKNESQHLAPEALIGLVEFLGKCMGVLNARLFLLGGFIGCCALFGFVMWQPDYLRAIIACAYTAFVYWPLLKLEARRQNTEGQQSQGGES